uniref:COPII vesicle protein n=2 Tax=Glossina morsitans morsitans TaxID=37546 RepID=D3TPF0_GLOMM
MTATLRYRGEKNNLIELAKNLDAFKKVPEKYTEATEIGGTLSLISRLLIIYLIYREVKYYQDAGLVYQFEPDIDKEKVQMHVDITVAMPCNSLSGVDLMDETQQDVFAYGALRRQGVWWHLTPHERTEFERVQHENHFLREEYHSVADLLFKYIIQSPEVDETATEEDEKPLSEEQYDACRLHGTLGINKVAGVLHLVGGTQPVVDLLGEHLMIGFRHIAANFTHRINRLSFGQYARRIVQPLEGDETFVSEEGTIVQYFLNIVPTEIHKTFTTISTYQYSVTENVRVLDSDRNSYGSPGIYFKYDWSALKIIVRTDRDNMLQFIIRLCSIISGIVVLSGILNVFLLTLRRNIIKILAPQLLQKTSSLPNGESSLMKSAQRSGQLVLTNELLSAANNMSVIDQQQRALITTFHNPLVL